MARDTSARRREAAELRLPTARLTLIRIWSVVGAIVIAATTRPAQDATTTHATPKTVPSTPRRSPPAVGTKQIAINPIKMSFTHLFVHGFF